jgi:hypothetical protein
MHLRAGSQPVAESRTLTPDTRHLVLLIHPVVPVEFAGGDDMLDALNSAIQVVKPLFEALDRALS